MSAEVPSFMSPKPGVRVDEEFLSRVPGTPEHAAAEEKRRQELARRSQWTVDELGRERSRVDAERASRKTMALFALAAFGVLTAAACLDSESCQGSIANATTQVKTALPE